jgi:hypothetical protein
MQTGHLSQAYCLAARKQMFHHLQVIFLIVGSGGFYRLINVCEVIGAYRGN